jgi:hypothetical protein
MTKNFDALLEEMITMQKKALLSLGRRHVPTLTSEDVLQPMDYPALEHDPNFRYEEGILAGLQSAQIALRSRK